MTLLTDVVKLTAVVAHGRGEDVVKAARGAGAAGALIHAEHGVGVRERIGILAIAIDADKDVVTMLVGSEQAQLTANIIYGALDMGQPGGGFIYLTPLEAAATYLSQEIRDRLQEQGP